MNHDEGAVGNLLHPVSLEQFFANYWENKPLHIGRSSSAHFAQLLSVADLEALLASRDHYFPTVQLTQSGEQLTSQQYCDADKKVIPLRLARLYQDGATIVISQAHRMLENLGETCRQLHSAFQLRCQANVYLSPPGKQGFESHYDTHDVFVMQISGKKTFSFYSPGVKLPFCEDSYDPDQNTHPVKNDEITLVAGDTLYIPRGMVHDGVADNDEPSLHITLGIFPVVIRDLLIEIVQAESEATADYRQSLPRSLWIQPGKSTPEIEIDLRRLLLQVMSKTNIETAMTRLRDEVALAGSQDCRGLLTALSPQVDLHTQIEIRHHRTLSLQRSGQVLTLRAPGQIIEFSEPLSSAVEWLVDRRLCQVRSLPGLNDEQKLALGNHLLRENVVVIEASD